MKHGALVALIMFPLALAGCASTLSGSSYSREDARKEMSVRMGVVESVREVTLEGTKTPIGPAAGAVVGGIAGSTIGHGRGSDVGAVLGAVAGGLAGAAVEEGVTKKAGLEITVRLDNGQYLAVVQEAVAGENFRPGERVRLLSTGGNTRVSR